MRAQRFQSLSQVLIRKPVGQQPEENERVQEGLDTLVLETKGGGSLVGHDTWPL